MPVPRYLNLAIVTILFLWPTAAADAQAEGPTYVVQEGDTLFGIAFIFGSTVNEVAAANGIENPSAIFPGQELVIPGLEGIQGSLRFEVLEFGETLTSRALRHGLPLDQLVQLNRVLLPQRFPAGQRVVLVEPEAPELPLPTAQRVMAARGDSLLELSARLNSDPWSIQAYNRLGARRWSVAAEMLYAPGGDSPPTAL
ncbi:MAG: LysM peptidoglycan-binding domain-containing protein, partial [Chloroflexota bacterium]